MSWMWQVSCFAHTGAEGPSLSGWDGSRPRGPEEKCHNAVHGLPSFSPPPRCCCHKSQPRLCVQTSPGGHCWHLQRCSSYLAHWRSQRPHRHRRAGCSSERVWRKHPGDVHRRLCTFIEKNALEVKDHHLVYIDLPSWRLLVLEWITECVSVFKQSPSRPKAFLKERVFFEPYASLGHIAWTTSSRARWRRQMYLLSWALQWVWRRKM